MTLHSGIRAPFSSSDPEHHAPMPNNSTVEGSGESQALQSPRGRSRRNGRRQYRQARMEVREWSVPPNCRAQRRNSAGRANTCAPLSEIETADGVQSNTHVPVPPVAALIRCCILKDSAVGDQTTQSRDPREAPPRGWLYWRVSRNLNAGNRIESSAQRAIRDAFE